MQETSALRGWLQVLRCVQILSLLVLLGLRIWMLATFGASLKDVPPQARQFVRRQVLIGITAAELTVTVIGLALCIVWFVLTGWPARRGRAGCCGNRRLCRFYVCDIIWDGIFAAIFCVRLVFVILRKDWIAMIGPIVMMVLYIVTAILSSVMGKRARQWETSSVVVPDIDAAVAAAPKTVAMV